MSTPIKLSEDMLNAAWTRWIRGVGIIVFVLAGLGGCIWVQRDSLLRSAADLWIVSDDVTQAEVVVVLGGGIDVRPFAAAELYHKGFANRILVSKNELTHAASIGAAQGHTEANLRVLLTLGVPDDAIETFGQTNKNTMDEAVALREWTEHHPVSTIIIPSEIFTARRVRWIFRGEFAGRAIRIEVPSFEPAEYTRGEWWKTDAGLISFQNEVLKYIYYRLSY